MCHECLCFAQLGINKKLDFDQRSASFSNIQQNNDTIIIFGNIIVQDSGSQYGMLIAKMDTLGNLIDYNTYFDQENDFITQFYSNSCIFNPENLTSTCVGQLFQRRNGFLIKVDNNLAVELLQEYKDNISISDFYSNIIKNHNGYIIAGSKQDINFVINCFVSKVNHTGEIIWEKKFDTPGMQTYIQDIRCINGNEYLVSASTGPIQGVSLPQSKFSTKIFAIDSLGMVKWQWQSAYGMEEMGARNVFKTNYGLWAYFSSRGWYNEEYNEISEQPVFILRDEQFNLVKYDTFGIADISGQYNSFNKVIQVADGGWMAVGNKPVEFSGPPYTGGYNSIAGWMLRLDPEGNQVWNRTDTAYWNVETGSSNTLYNVLELSSGSIIACGKSRMYEPVDKEWGWIIKVDKHGCIDTLCTTTSINSFETEFVKFQVFPNPANDYVRFSPVEENGFIDATIIISDMYGKTLKQFNMEGSQQFITWDASSYPSGVYFYQVSTKGKVRYSGKIILQK